MIPLSPRLAADLLQHRRQQAQVVLKAGPAYRRELDLVFANATGDPLDERYLLRVFKRTLKAAGLPETIRLYDLRHTANSLMHAAGESPKVLSERLGHSSTNMTMDVYTHVPDEMQEKATARLEELLSQ